MTNLTNTDWMTPDEYAAYVEQWLDGEEFDDRESDHTMTTAQTSACNGELVPVMIERTRDDCYVRWVYTWTAKNLSDLTT